MYVSTDSASSTSRLDRKLGEIRKMIQLLFTVLAAEAAVASGLLFNSPLRRLVVSGLDRLKRGGRVHIAVKTVAVTALVVLASSLYSMEKIRARSGDLGAASPTDQVLMIRRLLEAALIGYSLFLAIIIDRLHHYLRELRELRTSTAAANRALEESKSKR